MLALDISPTETHLKVLSLSAHNNTYCFLLAPPPPLPPQTFGTRGVITDEMLHSCITSLFIASFNLTFFEGDKRNIQKKYPFYIRCFTVELLCCFSITVLCHLRFRKVRVQLVAANLKLFVEVVIRLKLCLIVALTSIIIVTVSRYPSNSHIFEQCFHITDVYSSHR